MSAVAPDTRLNRGQAVLAAVNFLVLGAGALCAVGLHLSSPWLRVGQVAAVMAANHLLLRLARRRLLTGENLQSIWGPANLITCARGALTALLAGFVAPRAGVPVGFVAWAPAVLYTVVVCLDFADGWWARRSGTRTQMGAILDQEYDAFGMLLAFFLAIQWGRLPMAFGLVAVARYLFVLGLWIRRCRGLPVLPLPPSVLRRRLAGLQMGVLAVSLWPGVGAPATVVAETIVGLPLLLGFLRDWLLVTGRLSPRNATYVAAKRLLHRCTRCLLSPRLLRLLLWLPVPPLLYWALRDLQPRVLGALLGRLQIGQLAALLGLNLLFVAVLTARWWLILRGLGARVPFPATLAYRLSGFAVSYLTPGPQTGGEALQVYLAARRRGLRLSTGSASVLLDKSYELLGNFFFLTLGALAVSRSGILSPTGAAFFLIGAFVLVLPPACYLVALVRGRQPLSALLIALGGGRLRLRERPAGRRLVKGVQRSERLLAGFAANRRRLLGQLFLSFVLVWGISVLEMNLVLRFLGVRPGLLHTVCVLAACRVAFLLPLPGALGALELAQVGTFALLGYGPEAAVGLVLYVRARDLLFAAAGALFTLSALRRRPRPSLEPRG